MKHQFVIELENPTGSYYSGQLVRGKVVFASSSSENVLGLNIICEGKATVHWSEEQSYSRGGGSTTSYYEENFDNDEQYFYYDFWPLGNGHDQVTLVPGTYEYPFEFKLPDDTPSSWEGQYGGVRHSIKAMMKNKWLSDYKTDLTLAVTAKADLNLIQEAAKPGAAWISKVGKLCCCKR